jgi:hypothetical protein
MSVFDPIIPTSSLKPQAYVGWLAIFLVALAAGHLLSAPAVTARAGLLPFAVGQILLAWWWFTLVARRLNDAGRHQQSALAIAIVWIIAALFLTVIMVLQVPEGTGRAIEQWVPTSALQFVYPALALWGAASPTREVEPLDMQLAVIGVVILVPLVFAIFYSVWAVLQPSVPPKE